MLDFIVLGLIPGTNIAVGFYVYLFLVSISGLLLLNKYIPRQIHKQKLQKKAKEIDRLAL